MNNLFADTASRTRFVLGVLAGLGFSAGAARDASGAALAIDFEAPKTGTIMGTQYLASHGVTISADNYRIGGPDAAILFNSNRTNTLDDDLEFGGAWSAGNIAAGVNLNKFLIVAESLRDVAPADGFVDQPDDEAEGGTLAFRFSTPQTMVGFDLIDVELNPALDRVEFLARGVALASVSFDNFANPASPFFEPGVAYADRSANRISQITVGELGVVPFDELRFYMPECAAIDNLHFDNDPAFAALPEPASAAVLLFGGLALCARRRYLAR